MGTDRSRALTPDTGRELRSGTNSTPRRLEPTPTPGVALEMTTATLETLANDAPKPSGWIVRRVGALLSHFFQPGSDEEIRMLAERDWVMALRSLPGWSVERALDEMAWESTRRPTPAAVRQRAEQLLGHYTAELIRRKRAEEEAEEERNRVIPSPERKAEIAAELGLAIHKMPKGGDHED